MGNVSVTKSYRSGPLRLKKGPLPATMLSSVVLLPLLVWAGEVEFIILDWNFNFTKKFFAWLLSFESEKKKFSNPIFHNFFSAFDPDIKTLSIVSQCYRSASVFAEPDTAHNLNADPECKYNTGL
jgi:hypothetical protein